MTSFRNPTALILTACGTTLSAHTALADTWDNSAGNAQWSTATNWADNTEPTTTDTAIFPATIPLNQATILMTTTEFCSSLTFNNDYTLQGGQMFVIDGGINVANGRTATINTVVNGSAGLTKTGYGTLRLMPTSSNSFSGPITISAIPAFGFTTCTLYVRSNVALGNTANDITIDGGLLQLDGITNPTFLITGRTISAGPRGGAVGLLNNAFLDLNTALGANANTLTFTGQGTVELNPNSTRTGTTEVISVLLRINGSTSLGTGTTNLYSGATLEVNNGSGIFAGTVNLGAGTTLRGGTGTHTFSGLANVGGNMTINGGPASTDTLILGTDAVRQGAGFTTTVNVGTVRLDTANSYAGEWTIPGGAVQVGHTNALGTGTGPVVVGTNGLLILNTPTFARNIAMNRRLGGIQLLQNTTLTGHLICPDFGPSLIVQPFVGDFDVTFTGPASSLETVNAIIVGDGDGRSIRVLNGAHVTSGTVFGYGTISSPGNFTVNGTGSTWDCNDYLQIAHVGSGSLTVEAGGSVSTETCFVGTHLEPGEIASATITGTGSTLTCTNTLWAGHATFQSGGVANFSVLDGADVTSGAGIVGFGESITTATVSGPGSTWNVQNLLEVAADDHSLATVSVGNGGELSCAGLYLGNGTNTSATLNITGQARLNCGSAGVLMSQNGGASTLNLSGGIVDIDGNITDAGPGQSTFTLDGATLDMHNHAIGGASPIDIPAFRSGTLKNVSQINNGTGFNKDGTGTLFLNTINTYTGPTAVSDGTLYLVDSAGSNTGSGMLVVGNLGTLAGNGRTGGPVLNDGAVSPQDFNFDSTATLHMLDSYTQLADGSLEIQISTGGAHDSIIVTAQAVLSGTLNVSLLNGYVPAAGSTFDVIAADSINGTFTTTNLPVLPQGTQWQVDYLPTGVRLTVTGGCDATDFNNDGLFPDTADIDDYLSVFSGGPCSNDPNCGDVDFNNDGLFPDTLDIDSLLSVFSGGPCLM